MFVVALFLWPPRSGLVAKSVRSDTPRERSGAPGAGTMLVSIDTMAAVLLLFLIIRVGKVLVRWWLEVEPALSCEQAVNSCICVRDSNGVVD